MNQASNPNSNVAIDFDPRTSRFLITVPSWMVDKVRAIPNRRWDTRRRIWTAPALRANCRHLLDHFDREVFTSTAHAVALATQERVVPTVDAFPSRYRFKTTPRSYQTTALNRAWNKNAFAFFMDMGTGKTKTAIDLMSAYFMDAKVERVLIVTKYSTRMNWVREIEMHSPVATQSWMLDTTKAKGFADISFTPDGEKLKYMIVGTESLAAGKAIEFAAKFVECSLRVAIIVDEAHMIKNHSAVRSKNVVKLSKSANYRVVMTGTPIANGPMDVFMQFEFLDPNIIGIVDFYSFRNRYAIMGGYEQREIIGYQHMEELIELVSPFVFQVRKSDVLTELPPKVYETRMVQMNDIQGRIYKDIAKRDRTVQGDQGITINTVLERMLRLQEVTGGIITYERNPDLYNPEKFVHSRIPGKNPKIDELINIAEENEVSTIVWCRFIEEIRMVCEALREKYGRHAVVEIHGGVSEEDRDRNVFELFQNGRARFLVGNAATGGVGLNMTRAELVVYYSNSFNFVEREQSEDRAHRIGQTKSVTYIDLLAEGTVDEAVVQALKEKKNVSEFVRTSINSRNENNLLALGL